ncbi:MAG TPA: hypothetical protein V6C82_07520, partial [Chroococcales cyanobacterium]
MKKARILFFLFFFLLPRSSAFALVDIRQSSAVDETYPLLFQKEGLFSAYLKNNPGFERVLSFYPTFFNDAPSFAAFLKKVARWKDRSPK